jgi:hypothetical protein
LLLERQSQAGFTPDEMEKKKNWAFSSSSSGALSKPVVRCCGYFRGTRQLSVLLIMAGLSVLILVCPLSIM